MSDWMTFLAQVPSGYLGSCGAVGRGVGWVKVCCRVRQGDPSPGSISDANCIIQMTNRTLRNRTYTLIF